MLTGLFQTMRYILILLLLVEVAQLWGQNACNLVVEAGDDITICEGENTTLDGVVTGGNNPTFEWTPASGLSNPAILNPVASPTVTTTYLLTAMSNSDNIIENGGFETGDLSPSTSSYTEVSDPVAIALNAPNFYGILSVPQIVQAFGCTPDIGQYTMVIHGSTGVSVNFWCQTVDVTPNTDYKFSFKVFGIPYFFAPAPNIVLKVNGTQIGSVTAPNGLCAEASGNFTWNSGGATTADICMANATVAGLGSMCSVDDIEMVECCTASDSVTVTVAANSMESQDYIICAGDEVMVGGQSFGDAGQYEVVLQNVQGCDSIIQVEVELAEVEAFIGISNSLNCLTDEAVLDGSLSVGTFGIQTYLWATANGLFLSGTSNPSVTIGAPGVYTLTVTTSNGQITCTDDLTITVPIDTISPLFTISPAPAASCQDTAIILNAQGFNLPGNANITWTTMNGNILSGSGTLMPSVKGAGTYVLTIINPANGCARKDSVTVLPGGDVPVVQPVFIPTLTCVDTQAFIVVAVVQPDSGYTIQWTTLDGNILSGDTTLSLLMNKGGNYQIVVTETASGCTGSLTIPVDANQDIPTLTLSATDSLGCLEDSLALNALVLPGFDSLTYQWTTGNGLLLSGQDSLNAWAGGPGTYQIIIEETTTGCRDTAIINVISNGVIPPVNAGPDLIITCAVDTVFPNTSGTIIGPEYQYLWTTPNGGLNGDSLLQPGLFAPGIYILQVTNSVTLCQATDTLIVAINITSPGILIEPSDTLDCVTTQLVLQTSVTAQGTVSLIWTGPTGGILSGGTSINPTIGAPGWYVLNATDSDNQCVSIDSVQILQDIIPPVIALATPDSIDCNTANITLDASASGPVGQLTFAWSTTNGNIVAGNTTANPLVNAGGTYALILTNNGNGCTATNTVVVYQDPNLPTVNINPTDTLTCLINTLQLSASTGNTPTGATFLWTTADGQIVGPTNDVSVTVNQPGTYVFTLTVPSSGCQAIDQVLVVENVAVPKVSVPTPLPITCLNTTTMLLAQPVNYPGVLNYQWTDGGGLALGSSSSQTIPIQGVYILIWTVPENGCSDSTTILVAGDLIPPLADAGADILLPCGSQTTTLDGTASQGQGTLSYAWTTINGQMGSGGQTALPTVQAAGLYTLLVTDPVNGCTDSDDVQVSFGSSAGYAFQLNPPNCQGTAGSLVLQNVTGGTPPYTVEVQGISGTFVLGQPIVLAQGNWPISVTDGAGCRFDTVFIMPAGQSLNLLAPAEVLVSGGTPGTITLSGNFAAGSITSITWTPDQYLTPTADPLVWLTSPPSDLEYQVTVITVDGCEASAVIQIRVSDIRSLYIPNAFSPNNLDGINDTFFPNSNPGSFDRIKSMAVYDRWGNSLFLREDFPSGDATMGWDGTHRGKRMDPGVYVWVIEVDVPSGETRTYKGDVTLF